MSLASGRTRPPREPDQHLPRRTPRLGAEEMQLEFGLLSHAQGFKLLPQPPSAQYPSPLRPKKLEDRVRSDLRSNRIQRPPAELQGVSKQRAAEILKALDRASNDQVDAVFALLDDINPSWWRKAAECGLMFSHGASTAQIACHIGMVQRKSGKLDREGRDAWLKPLWETGILEKVNFDPKAGAFVPGHPPKSPYCAYRITPAFLAILKASAAKYSALLAAWTSEDATRGRLQVQAGLAAVAAAGGTPHQELITAACDVYLPKFLPGFEVLYIDATDGQRITPTQEAALLKAGIALGLADSMPDVLLWNPKTDALWVIDAVTSDGEVDLHKARSLTDLAQRCGKKTIGFTTAYATWKRAAARQRKHKNIAPGTYIWIREDGAKQLSVETFESSPQRLHQ